MPGRQHQAAPCISQRPLALKIQRLATVEGPDGRRTPRSSPVPPPLTVYTGGRGGGGTDATSQDVTNHHLASCVPALRFAHCGSRGSWAEAAEDLKEKERQTTVKNCASDAVRKVIVQGQDLFKQQRQNVTRWKLHFLGPSLNNHLQLKLCPNRVCELFGRCVCLFVSSSKSRIPPHDAALEGVVRGTLVPSRLSNCLFVCGRSLALHHAKESLLVNVSCRRSETSSSIGPVAEFPVRWKPSEAPAERWRPRGKREQDAE